METTTVYRGHTGSSRNNGEEHGNYYSIYGGYIGIMEKSIETTIVYRGYMGKMEKNMETTI